MGKEAIKHSIIFLCRPRLRIPALGVKARPTMQTKEGNMANNQDNTTAEAGYASFLVMLKRSTIAVAIITVIVVAIIASRA
jgi:hypothetical protein